MSHSQTIEIHTLCTQQTSATIDVIVNHPKPVILLNIPNQTSTYVKRTHRPAVVGCTLIGQTQKYGWLKKTTREEESFKNHWLQSASGLQRNVSFWHQSIFLDLTGPTWIHSHFLSLFFSRVMLGSNTSNQWERGENTSPSRDTHTKLMCDLLQITSHCSGFSPGWFCLAA